jgi:hypothetical protein
MSPITLGWSIDMRVAEGRTPPKGPSVGLYHHRLAWQDGKYLGWYKEEPGQHRSATCDRESQTACDGERMYMRSIYGLPLGKVSHSLAIDLLKQYPKADGGLTAQYVSDDYFVKCGFFLPVTIGGLQRKDPVRSQILSLLDEGAQLDSIDKMIGDGSNVLQLRIVGDNPER